MGGYFKLSIAALLPVAATAILYLLGKNPSIRKLPYMLRQVIIGVIFGGLAIVGTEWGIPLSGAQVNCRDAAVLAGGLMFGAPAGIIAGIIGGVERWIAVAWGVGSFTRVACSVSTILAGFYAAFLRKSLFENKKPGWFISLAIGVVMEVLHLTMVFITNMATPEEAMRVVSACTMPMVIANGVSVMLTAIVLSLLSNEKRGWKDSGVRISQTIQRWLLATVVLAFVATSFFVFRLQDEIASSQTDSLLDIAIDDVAADIMDASDANLLLITRTLSMEVSRKNMKAIADKYDVAEVSVIDKNGVIVDSNVPEFIGFSMASGEQSAEFLCLLDDTWEYVQDYGPTTRDSSVYRKYAGIKTQTGFLQVGYDAEQFQRAIDEQVVGRTKNRHVGETGYMLILDQNRNLVSAPEKVEEALAEKHLSLEELPEENVTGEMLLLGEKCYLRSHTAEGYTIVSVLPEEEALKMRNIALYVNAFLEILVFAILFGLIYLLVKRVVVDKIKEINGSLSKITAGDLDEEVNVRTNTEFASLSDDINSTVDTLKHYIDEASARIDKELDFAKNIQMAALPGVFPAFPKRKDFDIYAMTDPAKEVGGDFYDFYITHSDTLNFLVADVSGKGIPAAMFMMRAKTELKSLTEADLPLSDVFTQGNAALCEGNDAMFVTAWQGSVDLLTGKLLYANAGHNPPLVRHADGNFEYLRTRPGFVLAGMEGVRYKTQELLLQPGDTILLYTDGVPEATNAQNELYGEERLLELVNTHSYADMKALCAGIKADVDAFVGDAPQFDDITMVALHYFGQPPVPTIHFDEAKLEDINAVTEFVEAELEKIDCPMKIVTQMDIAIDELFSNIVHYGYPNGPGPITVELREKSDPHAITLRFIDEGIPYNPVTKEDPNVTLSAEERGIGGLGIYMVKKTMDDMHYEYEGEKNILTITKLLGD